MNGVLNERSLDGQFDSIEDFYLNLENDILIVLKNFKNSNSKIYKVNQIFDFFITSDIKLHQILHTHETRHPAIQRIKRLVGEIMYEPFIDDTYESSFEYAKDNNTILISFFHNDFKHKQITYKEKQLKNCFDNNSSLDHLYESSSINEDLYYTNLTNTIQLTFFGVDGRKYTQEAFENCGFLMADKLRIREKIYKLLDCISEKTPLTAVGKNMGDGLWEFRCDVSDGRIFRVFFTLDDGVIFLNGFIKKSQKTPNLEIERARSLMRLINN